MNRIKRITIKPVLNGFLVTVGCQEVVFTDIRTVAYELVRYHKDPSGVEQEYIRNAVNPTDIANAVTPAETPKAADEELSAS